MVEWAGRGSAPARDQERAANAAASSWPSHGAEAAAPTTRDLPAEGYDGHGLGAWGDLEVCIPSVSPFDGDAPAAGECEGGPTEDLGAQPRGGRDGRPADPAGEPWRDPMDRELDFVDFMPIAGPARGLVQDLVALQHYCGEGEAEDCARTLSLAVADGAFTIMDLMTFGLSSLVRDGIRGLLRAEARDTARVVLESEARAATPKTAGSPAEAAWREENRADRQRIRRANQLPDGTPHGHGHGDHGHQTTLEQHEHRVETGETPSGRTKGDGHALDPPPRSSGFRSAKAEAEAIDLAERELARRNPPKHKPNGMPNRESFTVEARSPEGFADESVAAARDAQGEFVEDSRGRRVATRDGTRLKRAQVVYDYVPATDSWQLVSYYPIP